MTRRTIFTAAAVLSLLGLLAIPGTGVAEQSNERHSNSSGGAVVVRAGRISGQADEGAADPAAARPRVPNERTYVRLKAEASRAALAEAAAASGPANDGSAVGRTPGAGWDALADRETPPDTTGAIGLTRYVELINTKYGIYAPETGKELAAGPLSELVGAPSDKILADPQVIWDPDTRRFYFLVMDLDVVYARKPNGVDYWYGFSKSASPGGPGGWCKYGVALGYDEPNKGGRLLGDYPKLGDTRHFLAWGVNMFDEGRESIYTGSEIAWVSKPKAEGTIGKCPASSTFRAGHSTDLKNADGSAAWTPVVVNQIDGAGTGWGVATKFPTRKGVPFLTLFKLTETGTGKLHVDVEGRPVQVTRYLIPSNAPQRGSNKLLDTLDSRLTQAVSAHDPFNENRDAIWTQHTVKGDTNTEIHWYEIDPVAAGVLQSGIVSQKGLYHFNAAISPDRLVNENVKRFGDSMAMTLNVSSSTLYPSAAVVTKVADGLQSAVTVVRGGTGPSRDPSCPPPGISCRWGDYAGAAPDPFADPNGIHGVVWFANQWTARGQSKNDIDWRTFVGSVSP